MDGRHATAAVVVGTVCAATVVVVGTVCAAGTAMVVAAWRSRNGDSQPWACDQRLERLTIVPVTASQRRRH